MPMSQLLLCTKHPMHCRKKVDFPVKTFIFLHKTLTPEPNLKNKDSGSHK